VTSTIREVDGLYDVCVCAQGAYPQTDATVAHKRLASALLHGRIAGHTDPRPKRRPPGIVSARL